LPALSLLLIEMESGAEAHAVQTLARLMTRPNQGNKKAALAGGLMRTQ
jgi:hypothetical protein